MAVWWSRGIFGGVWWLCKVCKTPDDDHHQPPSLTTHPQLIPHPFVKPKTHPPSRQSPTIQTISHHPDNQPPSRQSATIQTITHHPDNQPPSRQSATIQTISHHPDSQPPPQQSATLTPMALKSCGCLKGNSTISLI